MDLVSLLISLISGAVGIGGAILLVIVSLIKGATTRA